MNIDKKKLTIDEQIEDMKNKNISFDFVSEEEAKKFLKYNNYYFKIKSYLKTFEKYSSGENQGKYYKVDFAYIKELSTIDMYFRKTILNIALDIEHYLKVKLLYDIGSNYEENGYDIVEKFLKGNNDLLEKIKLKSKNSTCEKLINKNINHFAAWNIIEVLSFGDFINFYKSYYDTYNYVYSEQHSLVNNLKPVKFLRNAAAHNNCMINTLKDNKYKGFVLNKSVNSFISNLNVCSSNVLNKRMGNRVVHDFMVLLFVFNKLTSNKELYKSRTRTFQDLKTLLDERVTRHADYFDNNAVLVSNYKFIKNVVDKIDSNRV